MPLDTKRLIDLTEADILELIANGIEEGRDIDYKQTLKIATDGDKKEFLFDVSSFGNASGGHLIFGIAETDGKPEAITPLTIANRDDARLKIESLVRDGISPRLPVELAFIPVTPDGCVLVIRIARSWLGPHMVSFQRTGKFYSRNSAGKYQLDVGELRSAFTSGAQVGEAIRAFRQNRLSAIVGGETPIQLSEYPRVILHCCPYASTVLSASVDIRTAHQQHALVRPMYSGGFSPRFNFDGVIAYAPHSTNQDLGHAYFQLFRDGKIESVETRFFQNARQGKTIPNLLLEAACIGALARAFKLFSLLEVEAPCAVGLTLLGVKSYTLALNPTQWHGSSEIDRDALIIAPEIAESYDADNAAAFMRPIFDALWNAVGLSQCADYDSLGQPSDELNRTIQRMG